MKAKPTMLNRITYPAIVIAAFTFLYLSGAIFSAIIASGVGTVGFAYGWACE